MGSPHLEDKFFGGYCRFRSPLLKPLTIYKNYKSDREKASSRRSTMVLKNMLKNPNIFGEEDPTYFIGNSKYGRWKQNWDFLFKSGPNSIRLIYL
jgi:hypothetical protein